MATKNSSKSYFAEVLAKCEEVDGFTYGRHSMLVSFDPDERVKTDREGNVVEKNGMPVKVREVIMIDVETKQFLKADWSLGQIGYFLKGLSFADPQYKQVGKQGKECAIKTSEHDVYVIQNPDPDYANFDQYSFLAPKA